MTSIRMVEQYKTHIGGGLRRWTNYYHNMDLVIAQSSGGNVPFFHIFDNMIVNVYILYHLSVQPC